jgi:hypothetical protein
MAKKSTSIESLPAWVALSAGIVYATGFLIQFTYLNSIGIKESVTEPFKAKYIYLGLLCWQFPLCVALLLVGCGLAKSRAQREHEAVTSAGIHRTPEEEKKHKTEDSDTRVYWASMLIFVILLFIFYLFMLFSPPGFFFARQRWVVGFCIFVYIALNALRRTENWIEAVVTSEPTLKKTLGHLIPNSDHLTVGKMIRVALFVVALGLMVFTFDPFDPKKFWAKLFEMFLNEGYWYFVFLGIAASLFWFAFRGNAV